jgi:hypothetical protein
VESVAPAAGPQKCGFRSPDPNWKLRCLRLEASVEDISLRSFVRDSVGGIKSHGSSRSDFRHSR